MGSRKGNEAVDWFSRLQPRTDHLNLQKVVEKGAEIEAQQPHASLADSDVPSETEVLARERYVKNTEDRILIAANKLAEARKKGNQMLIGLWDNQLKELRQELEEEKNRGKK